MSYFVNKTDGSVIVVLDGTKDTTSTSLVLFGRLTTNYGDQTNENFVRLLENFSNSTSPPNPISGQLWFDRNTNNLKVYNTAGSWVTVGSVIQGNVTLSGNLSVGPNSFAVKDTDGNVQITNSVNNKHIDFFSNVAGTSTRVLRLNGTTGLVEVNANAQSSFGVTSKIYVDSEISRATSSGDTNLLSNVAILNANLVSRLNEENALRANITAANAQIALRDTIARVDTINLAIDAAIVTNLNAIYSNLEFRVEQTRAVEIAMTANVAAANLRIDAANVNIVAVNNRLDAVNLAQNAAINANLSLKSNLNSPIFTGIPQTPTAVVDNLSAQIASTAFVMNTLGANILPRIATVQTALNNSVTSLNASVIATNNDVSSLNNRLNSVNLAQNTALTANLSLKSDLNSPTFTGTPTAPTAAFGTNTAQVATTAFVMTRSAFWDGSRKFVSTGDPNPSIGNNGDFWFKYTP